MQKSKRVAVMATVLLLLPLELLILVGLWPYLPLVGKAFAGMLITFCVCGAVYAVALTYQRITAPRLIVERDVVVMLARDGYIHLSAEHEAAKLALPAPVTVTEERHLSEADKDLIDRSRVLAAHFEQGKGMHAIEKELGIPYNKVRDWCNTATALRAK